eukprot:154063_1
MMQFYYTQHQLIVNDVDQCIADMGMFTNATKCITLSVAGGCNKVIPFYIGSGPDRKEIPNVLTVDKKVKFLGMILPNHWMRPPFRPQIKSKSSISIFTFVFLMISSCMSCQ